MTQAAPSEQAAPEDLAAPTGAEPARGHWPVRVLASTLALLAAGLILALTIWGSGASLMAAMLRNAGETPATMASIAFAAAWGLSALGAIGGWLATAVQALRGGADTPHRIAVVLTVLFLLLGFSLASAWPGIAPWLTPNLDLFGLGSLAVAGAQSAAAIALGSAPRRLTTGLLPVLGTGVPAAFAGSAVIVAGGGRTFPPANLMAGSLGGEGLASWLALATLLVLGCFVASVGLAHRQRYEPVRLWARLAAVLALVVGLLTGAFLVVVNQLYQANSGTTGWPGTPYLPINLCGWVVAAVAVLILLLPDRGRPVPDLPPPAEGQA